LVLLRNKDAGLIGVPHATDVVDHLEIVRVDEEDGRLIPNRPWRTRNCSMRSMMRVRFGSPVQSVMVGLECNPLLMGHKFSVQFLAFNLAGLAYPGFAGASQG
jgi:hypothetical protein